MTDKKRKAVYKLPDHLLKVGRFPFGDCVSRVVIKDPDNPVIQLIRKAS